MPISRSDLLAQQKLIARLVAADITKADIAAVAGVEPCRVSKWITDGTDPREMTAGEERRLADAFGWDLVRGPQARAAGWSLSRAEAEPARDLVGASVHAVREAADVPRIVVELGARVRTAEGADAALREVREAIDSLRVVESALVGRQVA